MYLFRKKKSVFYGEQFHHIAQHPSWKTTSCQLSATDYSMYSQLEAGSWKLFFHPYEWSYTLLFM
jgi:hypothetical protein